MPVDSELKKLTEILAYHPLLLQNQTSTTINWIKNIHFVRKFVFTFFFQSGVNNLCDQSIHHRVFLFIFVFSMRDKCYS